MKNLEKITIIKKSEQRGHFFDLLFDWNDFKK